MPWTDEDDTNLVRATRRMLARNGGVLPGRTAPEWKKMHHRLGIDHPANQFHVHYNWICWVHKWGLDPRHPVTHAPEIAHRELLGCDFGPQEKWPTGAPKKDVMETARQRAREEDAWFRPSSAGAESESESESESEADAPPPPKRTRVKREQAPEAEEAESRVKAKVKKEAGEGKGITEKKKNKVEAVKPKSRPKSVRPLARHDPAPEMLVTSDGCNQCSTGVVH